MRAGERVAEGEWLVADRQTAGRGRQGRAWFDGAGNFMGSSIVRQGAGDPPAHTLAFAGALALYEAVLPLLPEPRALSLKWPNDLLLGEGKLAGILLEREADAVVVGIGVNLAAAPVLPDRPTASLAEIGPAPDRDTFAAVLAGTFDRELERWRTFGLEPMLRRWQQAAHPPGTALSIHEPSGATLAGTYAGLAPDGSLLLCLEDGSVRPIHAGDVTLA